MKFRRILLILAIATLSLTACKKEENPAPTETTAIEETTTDENTINSETDENMETITNADRGQATGEVVEAPTTENTEYDTTIEEGDYDEEVHGEQANQPPAEGTDEFQQMLEEMAKEIYNSNGGGITYIPADPAVEAALGGTYGTTESTDPDFFGRSDIPDHLKGGSLE